MLAALSSSAVFSAGDFSRVKHTLEALDALLERTEESTATIKVVVDAYDSDKLVALPQDWGTSRFGEYTMQCSHNTYIGGVQGGLGGLMKDARTVDTRTMGVSLDLGYRCIELDVHPKRRRSHKTEPLVVGHCGEAVGFEACMTNTVELSLWPQAIKQWLEDDEAKDDARITKYKEEHDLTDDDEVMVMRTPLVISVENHAEKGEQEAYLASQLKAIGESRLVLPADFLEYKTLADFMGPTRRVIIKTGPHGKEKTLPLNQITAMPKDAVFKGQMASTSKMPGDEGKMADALAKSKLVRIYPVGSASASQDYDALDEIRKVDAELQKKKTLTALTNNEHVTPQMVCLNYQDECPDEESMCVASTPTRGKATKDDAGSSCGCSREQSSRLETFFACNGYDSYVHWPTKRGALIMGASRLLSTEPQAGEFCVSSPV